jgi:shikimate 5-dehydrogenase
MLSSAGHNNKLAAAQWLRQQGADWPAVLVHNVHVASHTIAMPWPTKAVAWAREQGCTSPTPTN